MTPSSCTSTAPLFRFQPRRESVDWRKINAVDIDTVVCQMDVGVLQEYITAVTYCRLDGQCCPRCQSPVDPALIKLFRLAQLTVEYLLHCQDLLTMEMHALEEKLEAADKEHAQQLAQLKKKEEQIKMQNEELKQRKKIIRMQQKLFAPSIINGNKCLHCDKSFLNATFLQNHMQRRHQVEYEPMLSEGERKLEIDDLKSEITVLKEQIVQQQQTLQTKIAQEKEQESLHRDLLRELDLFKAEEVARMDRKIEESRDGMRREIEFLYTQNIKEANRQQSTRPRKSSPVQIEPEKDLDNYKEMQQQAIYKLDQQLKKQDKMWRSRLQEIKDQHESEKNQLLNELNRMQINVLEQHEDDQRLRWEFGLKLQEKEQAIQSQKEQIQIMSSSPPAKLAESQVPQTSAAPEHEQKRVVNEEPLSAPLLDPIQELSEEDRESSDVSEAKPVERKPEPAPENRQQTAISVLKRSPNLRKERKPELERSLMRELERYGIKHNCSGLATKEMQSILLKVHAKQHKLSQEWPEFWSCRQKIINELEDKLGGPKKKNKQPMQVLQSRPRSDSFPSRTAQVSSERLHKYPLPTPRTKITSQPKTSTPKNKTPQMRYSSISDEESEEEEIDTEEELQLDLRNKSIVIQNRTTAVLTKQASVTTSNIPQSRGLIGEVAKTMVTEMESEDEDNWSEVSELQEIDPKGLQSVKDQNGNVEKKSFGKENKISEMGKKIEKQFTDRLGKKPAGGISILPERKDEVQELSCTDLEESNEWGSSLEEKVSKPVQSSVPLRKSLDSASTSVWGTSTGKGPKSSLTEAGTGSTLKSSIYTFSDDSDDKFSNN